MLRTLFICCLLLTCISCNYKTQEQAEQYFSLDRYFDAETKRMTSQHMAIRKTIQQGDSIETYTDSFPDWNRELSVFRDMDINKSINKDAYEVDTVTAAKERKHILIEARDYKKSPVQTINIQYDAARSIEMITVHYHSSNAMHEADYSLSYLPGKGYNISGFSKSLSGEPQHFDIHAEIARSSEL